MVITLPEKKTLATQRRIRRLRQQRLLSSINHLPNGKGTMEKLKKRLTIYDLGWTPEQALANHRRYSVFEEDWNAPGMEIYDKLYGDEVREIAAQRLAQERLATQRRIRKLRRCRLLRVHNHSTIRNGIHASGASEKPKGHSIKELGWTREQARATYYKLKPFEEDWNAPGMELYDDL